MRRWQAATRVPLMVSTVAPFSPWQVKKPKREAGAQIKVPWKPESQGQRTASLTELVDMHPTVAALAGIPFTQPMDIGGPDDLGAGEMDAAPGDPSRPFLLHTF